MLKKRKQQPFFYLASQSPRRRHLLKRAGFSFQICSTTFKEKQWRGLSPRQFALRNAAGKAKNAKIQNISCWVLGADTVVACQNKILGKPRSITQAKQCLKFLSGKTHRVYTAIVFYQQKSKRLYQKCICTQVRFKKLSHDQIQKVVQKTNPLDKAAGYAIQTQGKDLVASIKGPYTNVIGLPIQDVRRMIHQISKK